MVLFRRHRRSLSALTRWGCAIALGVSCAVQSEQAQGQISSGDPVISQLNQSQMPMYGAQMTPGQMPGGQMPIGQMQGYNRQSMPAQTQASSRPGLWPGAAPQSTNPRPAPVNPTGAPANPAAQPMVPPGAPASYRGAPAGPVGPSASAMTQQASRPNWTRNNQQLFVDTFDLGGSKIIARVGQEIILQSEVSDTVDDYLTKEIAKMGPSVKITSAQIEEFRDKLMYEKLQHLISVKLALNDARRKIPEESLQRVMDSIESDFDTKEVPRKLKEENLKTVKEFDAALRARGSSLDRQRQSFVESQVAMGWLQQATHSKHEITHLDLLAYYEKHSAEYEFPARARFEQLLVRVPNPSARAAARKKLEAMGNEVWYGANFADVARARSQGSTASQGGVFDWTDHKSLASKALDKAVFSLEIGKLSSIIEDERGMSIIRVIERKDAGKKSFVEVQDEIKDHLEKEKRLVLNDKMKEFLAKCREETPIWTIYDNIPIEEADNITARKGSIDPSAANQPTRSAAAPTQNGPVRQ